ncbi:MAG: HEXXH motif-containing putative peptide modification protein [Myxococcota bacterium]
MVAPSPLALTLPSDGMVSTRRTALRFLKRMARDSLRLPPSLFAGGLEPARRALDAKIAWFGEHAPAALYGVLRRPQVHVLLTTALRAIEEGDADAARYRSRAFAFQLLLELAADGRLGEPVPWDGAPPVAALSSPTRRMFIPLPDRVEGLTFRNGAVVLASGDGISLDSEPSDRFVPVAPGMMLCLEDNNPISDFEAHPDKAGNQLDLGTAPASRWAESIEASLEVIGRIMPELRQEMDLVLQQFVPVGTDDERHLSASYREAIGTIYLTLHPRQMTMTEAVVHEYQHNKINALFHVDAVMENAWWPLFPSPVRPDPRPLHGVLLAAHAFVPVAEMYFRMIDVDAPEVKTHGFQERLRQIVGKNQDAMHVLEANAVPTESGAQVLEEMGRLHRGHLERLK